MRKNTRFMLIATAMVTLSGCVPGENPFRDVEIPSFLMANKQAAGPKLVSAPSGCPLVSAVPELARVTQFADESILDPQTILSETELVKIDASCITTETSLNLDIALNFTSTLGTEGLRHTTSQSSYSHAYFVAVIAPDGSILAKDVFGLSPVFSSGQKIVYSSERLQQTIPLSTTIPAQSYKIMIGFQLTENELAYNRSLSRPAPAAVNPVVTKPAATTQTATSSPAPVQIEPLKSAPNSGQAKPTVFKDLRIQPLMPRHRKGENK